MLNPSRFSTRVLQCRCLWPELARNDCFLRLSTAANPKLEWDRAVSDAEKLVGYPPSFANLKWLLSDEFANVALHVRKLFSEKLGMEVESGVVHTGQGYDNSGRISDKDYFIGRHEQRAFVSRSINREAAKEVIANHPILTTAKSLLSNAKNNMQNWGLLMLLISKAAGHTAEALSSQPLIEGGVLPPQRTLAELTEMIKIGHLVHKGLINLPEEDLDNADNMNFGNKIALLTGDYLLVTANYMLAGLRDQHISEIISTGLRDLSDGEFYGDRDPQNFPIPTNTYSRTKNITCEIHRDPKIKSIVGYERKFDPIDTADCLGNPVREWTLRTVLTGGSLLGKGCEAVVHAGGHEERLQGVGYSFGCHVALAWQAAVDSKLLEKPQDSFSLVSAPVLFALHNDPTIHETVQAAKDGVECVDYEALYESVKKSPALEFTNNLFREHSNAALETLKHFPSSEATNVLRNMIVAMDKH